MALMPGGNVTQFVFVSPEGLFHVCISDKRVSSNGIFLGDNPFAYTLPASLMQIVLVAFGSRLLYFVLRPLRTPKFVCCVLGGILIGPSIIGRNDAFRDHLFPARQAEFLYTMSTLGSIYSLFFVSLKMDIVTTLRAAKKTWRFGILPPFFSFIAMSGLLHLYDSRNNPSLEALKENAFLFISFASLSSFAVISDALMELNLITSELGQIALSSTMLNDAILWTVIIVRNLLKPNNTIQDSVQFLSVYWGLMFLCIFIVRPLLLKLAKSTPIGKPVQEVYIVMILLGVLVMAGITDMLGLSFLQGPLLFGLIMPNGPPLGTTIIDRSADFVSQILIPLFFTYVGFGTDSSKIQNKEMAWELQLMLVAGCLAKLFACMLVSKTYKIKLKQGLVLGLIFNLKGMVELIVFLRMRRIEILDFQNFSHVVIASMAMTAIISPIIEKLYKPHIRLEKPIKHGSQIRTIQNSPKNSEFHVVSCIHNERNVHSIIALLEASNPNESSPIWVYVIHLIELLGKSTPVLLPFEKHKRKLSLINPNTNHIMRAFENYSLNSYGPVNILPHVNIAPYKNMHVSICNLIQDKSIPFLIIPFHQDNKTPGNSHLPAVRDLNAKLQACAPCTVGVLVDKNSHPKMGTSEFCFHVGIFFVGGADDREALALGARMSENENVLVSLYQFLLKNKKLCRSEDKMSVQADKEEAERILDEHLIDEFKAKNIGNSNVVCHEIEVNDGIQVLEEIRVLEGNYDLVMVGKQHDIGALKDLEMSEFVDNAEMLGVFGDMLASNEFCNGRISVLVMQCGGRRERDFERTGSSVTQGNFV